MFLICVYIMIDSP